MEKIETGVLFSGGKDSCLALHKFGIKNVNCLLSIIPENRDSYMFHKPDLRLLKKQAEMLNLPLIMGKTKGEKEKELGDLKKLIRKSEINELVVGGIKSNYQAKRVMKICSELGVKMVAPLWDYSGEKLWKELLKENFKVIITKIACEGIPKEFIGKIIDEKKFNELKKPSKKYKFQLSGEGGEFETSVLFMPGMKKEIELDFQIRSEGKYRHFLRIKTIKK